MECLASRGKAPGSVLAISISLLLSPLSLPLSHPPSLSYSYPQHSPHKDQAIIKSHGVKLSRGDSHGQSVSEQRLRRELLDRGTLESKLCLSLLCTGQSTVLSKPQLPYPQKPGSLTVRRGHVIQH